MISTIGTLVYSVEMIPEWLAITKRTIFPTPPPDTVAEYVYKADLNTRLRVD